MMRAATPSVQAEAETRMAVDLMSLSSQRPAASLSSMRRSAVAASGHAQQRLGEHHQREPFLGRQRIGVQKILDAAKACRLGADRLHQPARARIDAAFRSAVAVGFAQGASPILRPAGRMALEKSQPWDQARSRAEIYAHRLPFATRGRMNAIVLATQSRPSFAKANAKTIAAGLIFVRWLRRW